jgi:hypothetical protein
MRSGCLFRFLLDLLSMFSCPAKIFMAIAMGCPIRNAKKMRFLGVVAHTDGRTKCTNELMNEPFQCFMDQMDGRSERTNPSNVSWQSAWAAQYVTQKNVCFWVLLIKWTDELNY